MTHRSVRRIALFVGIPSLILLAACSDGGSSSKVASLGGEGSATTTTLSAKDSQEAILAYAACMRENGVDMKDPTFDADGNMTGGGIGRDSGIDPRSEAFQTAQTACGSLVQGIDFRGGRRGGNFDPTVIQAAMNDFTACLRDQGLDVDDMTFGQPGDGQGGPPDANGGNGGNGGITIGTGSTANGNGGFDGGPGGTPPDGSRPANGNGGAGFDPTARIIERLGLDSSDPTVTKAIDACQAILTTAFTPTSTTQG